MMNPPTIVMGALASLRKDSLFATSSLFGLLPRDMGLLLAPPHSLRRPHCIGKKVPLKTFVNNSPG